jgi:hypothetical protein
MLLAQDPQLFARFHFAADVNLRRGMMPDQNHGKAWTKALGSELSDLVGNAGTNLGRDFASVQNDCRHAPSPTEVAL